MRLKDTKTVKAMIDRMNAQGGTEVVANPELAGDEAALTGLEVAGTKYKVEGDGTPSVLELNVDLSGTLPVGATVEDEEDIAKLEAIKTAFLTDGTLPPTYYKIEETEEGYRGNNLFSLSQADVDAADTDYARFLYGRTNYENSSVFIEYIEIEKAEADGIWSVRLGDSENP